MGGTSERELSSLAAKLGQAKNQMADLERQIAIETEQEADIDRELLEIEGEISLLRQHLEEFVARAEEMERKNEAIEQRLTTMKARMSNARATLDIDCEAVARVQRKLTASHE